MDRGVEHSLELFRNCARDEKDCYFRRRKAIQRFLKDQPSESAALERHYDSLRPGWYHWLDRIATSKARKLAISLYEVDHPGRWKQFARKHATTWVLLLGTQVFISALCPAHPLAIDAYLVVSLAQKLGLAEQLPHKQAFAGPDPELRDFILSPGQIQRYREDLLEDAEDTSSESGFVIVRNKDGGLEQIRVQSMHEHLGNFLPGPVRRVLDRRFIFSFNERVALWMKRNEIVASGHYQVYGGPPSAQDIFAMEAAAEPLLVVSNGIIPFVYFEGQLLDYGQASRYAPELDDWLNVVSAVVQYSEDYTIRPDKPLARERVRSFLYFLEKYEDVDIEDAEAVKRFVRAECRSQRLAFAVVCGPQRAKDALSNFLRCDLLNLENYYNYVDALEKGNDSRLESIEERRPRPGESSSPRSSDLS